MKSDAERLISGHIRYIAAAAFAFAPERAQELSDSVMGDTPWDLQFEAGGPTMVEALVTSHAVRVKFAALLSVWATAAGAFRIANAGMAAIRSGLSELPLTQGTDAAVAIELKDAALALIRDPAATWPAGLPIPNASTTAGSDDEYVDNIFLGAFGFITLHEIAHIHLGHSVHTARMHEQEADADHWAASWALRDAPTPMHREFRALSIAVALSWIGLTNAVHRTNATHPHASERLGRLFRLFQLPDESPALEVAAYVTKSFFDPYTPIPAAEHATDAFTDVLIGYTRLPR